MRYTGCMDPYAHAGNPANCPALLGFYLHGNTVYNQESIALKLFTEICKRFRMDPKVEMKHLPKGPVFKARHLQGR